MRIAFFVDTFPALAQSYVLNQITGLIDMGHQVDIYSATRGETVKVHPDVVKYDLLNKTVFQKNIPTVKLARIAKAALLMGLNLLKNPGATMRSLNSARYGKFAKNLDLFYFADHFIRQIKKPLVYDVALCHFGPIGQMSCCLRDMGLIDAKIATVFHGYDISLIPRSRGNDVYDFLFANGDLLLPISENWKNKLIALGCPVEKIIVHHMGVCCEKFNFKMPQPGADGKIRFITAARLSEKKGLKYAIEAIKILSRTHSNIEFVIIGGGPLQQKLENLIEKLQLGKVVKLLGWKDQQEIVDYLERAHIYLAPSVTDKDNNQEGIPVAIMEAMAMGLTVVSTFHSGIPELVQDGVSGFLVAERDVEALAEKLRILAEEPDLWPNMARQGRQFVEQQFNVEKLNHKLIDLFEDLLIK